MTPLISIVTGTYNRLPLLQQMIDSIRRTLPDTIAHEVVVVDGGSSDGTVAWCEAQPDVVFIQQGELLGAIRAFNAGAYAARGRYVVLANDDVLFHDGSLLRAFVHLEDTPTCGAVAFADNRSAAYKREVIPGYGVQIINAYPRAVVYAQVGMFRRWLGNLVGWWGHDDPIMRDGRTYGGDSYLSARLWELGYTVDAVEQTTVHDLVYRDDLRERNLVLEQQIQSPYYRRYPQGPRVSEQPLIPPQDGADLRILYLPIYEPGWPVQKAQKRGLREALQRVGQVWEIDYCNTPFDLVNAAATWKPDLLLLQCHAADLITPAMLARARAVHPEMVVVNWNGDVWDRGYTSPAMIALLEHVDMMLGVNLDALGALERMGIRAGYWQNAFEPVDTLPDVPAHDVVVLMSNNQGRRSDHEAVFDSFGVNVGLYGAGWKRSTLNTTYDFEIGRALYRNARLTIGDNQHENRGFVSNRLFEALAAGGALMLQQRVPELEMLTGLKDGVHYVEWTDYDDLRAKVAYWLDPKREKKRRQIVATAQAFALERHSFDARVRQLFTELLPRLTADDPVTA